MLLPIYDRKIRRIADKSLTNRAIDRGSCGWSYEKIWPQEGLWSCSKLCTYDNKSQEVAVRSYMIVRRVVQGRTINRACTWADKSRDWSGDCLGGHAIVVPFVEEIHDWYYDLLWSVTTGCTTINWLCDQSPFAGEFISKRLGSKITLDICVIQECLKSLLETTVACQVWLNQWPIWWNFWVILVRHVQILHWKLLFSLNLF